jgi:hypothetical protein
MKDPTARDTLDGFLHDIDVRIARQERHTHHSVGEVIPAGAMVVSADHNNATRFGTDAGIYTREIVAKADVPTAADFGGLLLPGSVWVDVSGGPPSVCVPWSDDFERADGPMGSDWIAATSGPVSGVPEPLVIASGAAVDATASGTEFGDDDPSASFWATAIPGDHFIELDVESMGGGTNYLFIYSRFDPITWTGIEWNFVTTVSSPWEHGNFSRTTYTNGAVTSGPVVVGDVEPLTTLRVESSGGTSKLYANGVLVDEIGDTDHTSGEYVGFGAGWSSSVTATASPRVASVTGGCLE